MARNQKSCGTYRASDVVSSPVFVDFFRSLARATGRLDIERDLGDEVQGASFQRRSMGSAEDFAVDYLWEELLSKYDDGKSSDAKRDVALAKFRESEMQCGRSNSSISRMVGLPSNLAVTDIERTMCLARRKVREILGPLDLNRAARGMCFTGGASTRLRKRNSSVTYKYSGTPETTLGNANLAWAAVMSTPLWKRELCSAEGPIDFKLVSGNRITTVPKNYKTDRCIAIEPDMNMYVQKGFGNYIRQRLKRWGIDLNSQSCNQDLALLGSATGLVATLDLSSASDTICTEIVRFLLPSDWLEALEQCRSSQGVLPSGEVVYFQKFSSMGNGFTFELESLIFYSLAVAATELSMGSTSLVSVYGDDIIVPTSAARLTIETLEAAGFSINTKKSFIEGPFRESCGKHYFQGREVTPFYVRRAVRTLPQLFLLHNKLYRWYHRCCEAGLVLRYDEISTVIKNLRQHAPRKWRSPRLPDGYGDGAFIGTFDDVRPSLAKPVGFRRGWDGFICEVIQERNITYDFHEGGILARLPDSRKLVSLQPNANDPVPTLAGRLLMSLEALELVPYEKRDASSRAVVSRQHGARENFQFIPFDGFAQWLTPLIC